MRKERADRIRAFITQAIHKKRKDVVARAASEFGISRQAIHGHLKTLVSRGIVAISGKTKGRLYTLRTLAENLVSFSIEQHPSEDKVWQDCFANIVSALPENVRAICYYGFTEMFNNAIDHSEGKTVTAKLELTDAFVIMNIRDDGVGIFKKIQKGLNLADEHDAILELSKGKITTDPEHHSGEGVFFTSRMFDTFELFSDRLFFHHEPLDDDWLTDSTIWEWKGTTVVMEIGTRSRRMMREVFDRFTTQLDEPTFDKTNVIVNLLRTGKENLVSRSQAKRLLARFDKFKEVLLDFEGVNEIGQAFADEIFRVYANHHPDVQISFIGASKQVERMIHWVGSSIEPKPSA